MKKLALISVSDKTKIVEFAKGLVKNGYDIIATGNTAKLLSENKIDVTEISSITGFPEIFDGRVKTLHPKIFGGILFRRDNDSDIKEAKKIPLNQLILFVLIFIHLLKLLQIQNRL